MDVEKVAALREDLKSYDQLFAAWLEKNPGKKFSDFSNRRVTVGLSKGAEHQTLGVNIRGGGDWWLHGEPAFRAICAQADIPVDARICEVGCGSARVGAHFIRRQDKDCYLGLDVTAEFIKYADELVGDLLKEKEAKFGVVPDDLARAAAWNADVLYSTAVTLHVHPNEIETHYDILKRLAHKSGATVILQCYIYDEPVRFARSGWAWTEDHFIEMMSGFEHINTSDDGLWQSNGYDINVHFMTFKNMNG